MRQGSAFSTIRLLPSPRGCPIFAESLASEQLTILLLANMPTANRLLAAFKAFVVSLRKPQRNASRGRKLRFRGGTRRPLRHSGPTSGGDPVAFLQALRPARSFIRKKRQQAHQVAR